MEPLHVEESLRIRGLGPLTPAILGKKLTTMAIGGPLSRLIEPSTPTELAALLRIFHDFACDYLILGAGSNVVIPSSGMDRWIIRLGKGFRGIEERGAGLFEVGAAASLMTLARELSQRDLSGLEFAGGIPASLGGAVFMNAGAHGGEMSSVVKEVAIMAETGELQRLPASALKFGYRHSELPKGAVVISALLQLTPTSRGMAERKRAECLAERKARQPLTMPSSGSVFRNPSSTQSAGFLIENAGLKGTQCGGAMISSMHANWIVNPERSATDRDVKDLIGLCQVKVKQKFDIALTPEIVLW